MIVALVNDDTGPVVIVNVALVAPSGTVTDAGAVATDGLLLDKEITAPPAGAGATNFTVPIAGFPSVTPFVGDRLSEKGRTVPRLKKMFALPPGVALCSQTT